MPVKMALFKKENQKKNPQKNKEIASFGEDVEGKGTLTDCW